MKHRHKEKGREERKKRETKTKRRNRKIRDTLGEKEKGHIEGESNNLEK